MASFNISGAQNVEVSIKLPCEKSFSEQLNIMEQYTHTHHAYSQQSKAMREYHCLKVIFPRLFRRIEDVDLIAGRLDFLPIGFGCVTSVGGVGHYCVFDKLEKFKENLSNEQDISRVDTLYQYWLSHDVKALYCKDVLTPDTVGRFINCDYPLMATARLSGLMLDYRTLLELGVEGLKDKIARKIVASPNNDFLQATQKCLDLLVVVIDHQIEAAQEQKQQAHGNRIKELDLIVQSLTAVRHDKPGTFHQALQLFWLYALLAGCINYGRLDDLLGTYLQRDLAAGTITENDALRYLKSLWTLIENRRTTVNGRIIVGGYGRRDPEAADLFARLALRVTYECKYVEPQFTLRLTRDTPQDIVDLAYDCLGKGCTYPTLYNDEVNVPAVMYSMRVDRKTAEQYVPFGCGEFVIQGQSVGTPNVLINLLKLLNITTNRGIDPVDGIKKCGDITFPDHSAYTDFDAFYSKYKEVLNYYLDLSVEAQHYSYTVMNNEVSFLFASVLMDDCIEKGQSLLAGGVRYLGGTNETYGNINASDALFAIKTLVFDSGKYTLEQLNDAAVQNFVGYESIRKDLLACDKYGNDLDAVDAMANELYEFVARGNRDRGIAKGMDYFLIVISNNQTNTEWGRKTSASLDGRLSGQFMNPANNPQGGANKNGPTALLNSLANFDAKYHGGSVQNIKFTPDMFNHHRDVIKSLFATYFKKGGCHLMVTVVDRGILEDAQKYPENYPDLIVRVSGFSAVFVNLDKDVQDELISRVLYG